MGIKTKITVSLLSLVFLTASLIVVFSYVKSSSELKKAVEAGNISIAETVATKIQLINEKEFKMLTSVVNMPLMKDESVDLREKWEFARNVIGGDSRYSGIALFNTEGAGYATTGAWSDLHSRYYVSESMKGNFAMEDPDFGKLTGKLISFYAIPVKSDSGKQIGEIAAVVDAADLCRAVSAITVGKSSHPFVISRTSGKSVAHENIEVISDGVHIDDYFSKEFQPIKERIMAGEAGSDVFFDTLTKHKYAVSFTPIAGSNWTAVCLAPYEDFFSGITELLQFMIILAVCALVIAAVVGMAVVYFSVKPLKDVSSAINGIASGDADLTKRLVSKTADEIGSVVSGFNAFSNKLQSIIGGVKLTKEDLTSAGSDMERISENMAISIEEILANIKSAHAQIEEQSGNVGETAGAVNEIAQNIVSLEKMIETQSEGVTQASAAVEQMIGNISSVNHSVDKMAQSFNDLRSNSEAGFSKQQTVNERVKEIESQSQMLQEANSVISAIASQTNLLAMNAAIEAAHAGEAGQGFAVVADEIRKLSETSTSQSKTIGIQIKNIRDSINSVVKASSEASSTFSKVSEKLGETDALVLQIKSAMEEQNEGSKQIIDVLHTMNDSTVEVRTASAEMENGNKIILSEVQQLQNATISMRESTEEMAESARRISETGSELGKISGNVKHSIEKIGSQVDQFKI